MAVVYRTSDRVTLKIDDVTLKLAPLSYSQKMKIQGMLMKESGTQIENIAETTRALIEFSVKSIDGVHYSDGEKFELEFDEGKLSEDSIDNLLNMEISEKLQISLMQLTQGIPTKITDQKGNEIEGVKIVPQKGAKVKK